MAITKIYKATYELKIGDFVIDNTGGGYVINITSFFGPYPFEETRAHLIQVISANDRQCFNDQYESPHEKLIHNIGNHLKRTYYSNCGIWATIKEWSQKPQN